MNSPDYVQTSLAAAMTLGFENGRFHRGATLTGLNILLKYDNGCRGRCTYCGLAGSRVVQERRQRTFIRVKWPTLLLEDIIIRTNSVENPLRRVCLSMITAPGAKDDSLKIVSELNSKTSLPISVLIAPTVIKDIDFLKELKEAGADRIGVAVDCATEPLFEKHRGRAVVGPHSWKHYWQVVDQAIEVFGRNMVGIHFIVGLGETEEEMIKAISSAFERGAMTHLFSFFPEEGSVLEGLPQPDIGAYRRIQLARYLINEAQWGIDGFIFDDKGLLVRFDSDVSDVIQEGVAFMTSGCPGPDGIVACNRPFGNELPSQPMRNFPFMPEEADIADITDQLTGVSWTTSKQR